MIPILFLVWQQVLSLERDWTSCFIQAEVQFFEGASILVAEATILCDGIRGTLAGGYHCLIVEGENRVVIQMVQGHIHFLWHIQTLLQDVYNMHSPNVHCLFQHTYR